MEELMAKVAELMEERMTMLLSEKCKMMGKEPSDYGKMTGSYLYCPGTYVRGGIRVQVRGNEIHRWQKDFPREKDNNMHLVDECGYAEYCHYLVYASFEDYLNDNPR